MVLGLTRGRVRTSFVAHAVESADTSWLTTIGQPIYATTCEVAGAFPGYARYGGRLEHAQVRVYEHLLTVDEMQPRGFALPFDQIVATDDGDPTDLESAGIRVRYQDGEETRLFSMSPRASRLMLRGGRRAFRLLDELSDLGVPGGPLDDIPGESFVTSWNEAGAFGHETMVWHGHASTSVALSGERSTCDVFITSKSLVWGRDAQSPITRVPLEMIRDVTPGQGGSRDQEPMAFVGIGDSSMDRIELGFLFDAHDTDDRNALERSAFVVHLRSRNVPLVYPGKSEQPWIAPIELLGEDEPKSLWPQHSVAMRQPHPFPRADHEPVADDAQAKAPANSAAERLRPDRGVITAAEWSTADAVSSWAHPVVEAIDLEEINFTPAEDIMLSEWAPPESPFAKLLLPEAPIEPLVSAIPEPERIPIDTADDDEHVSSDYEAEALAALGTILDTIRKRESGERIDATDIALPGSAALAGALQGIAVRRDSGALDATSASAQRTRLLALDDVMRRLDLLLPLHAHGAISLAELSARRDALCADLSAAIFAAKS